MKKLLFVLIALITSASIVHASDEEAIASLNSLLDNLGRKDPAQSAILLDGVPSIFVNYDLIASVVRLPGESEFRDVNGVELGTIRRSSILLLDNVERIIRVAALPPHGEYDAMMVIATNRALYFIEDVNDSTLRGFGIRYHIWRYDSNRGTIIEWFVY